MVSTASIGMWSHQGRPKGCRPRSYVEIRRTRSSGRTPITPETLRFSIWMASSLIRTIGAIGQFSFPNAVAVDGTGTMYVSDSNNGRLVVLDPSGVQIATLRRGPYEGDLGMPRGLAIDDEARLYVVDTTDQSVKVYRQPAQAIGQPAYLGRFGAYGRADGAFSFPNAVATDARGRVYVADWDNDRVQIWSY